MSSSLEPTINPVGQTPTGFVYLWINRISGKQYLGSHIGTLDDGYLGSGVAFLRARQAYGEEYWVRVILEANIPRDRVRNREQHYLDFWNVVSSREFYNISGSAGGGFDHINRSPDKAEYQFAALTGYREMLEQRGHPRGFAGKSHSDVVRAKMSRSIRKAMTTRIGRPVLQCNELGQEIARFLSIAEAARAVKTSPSNIQRTCRGEFKTCRGFVWKYSGE